jgi:hypothetical protein
MEVRDDKRTVHCFFMRDNGQGRCIAPCHHAVNGTDCMGNTGSTLSHDNHFEVRVSCGFLNGAQVLVDDKGYKRD